MELPKAALVLADGTVFPGWSFGAEPGEISRGVLGEVVFNTAMTGYQEIVTDPSYYGQIVVMTYPHIGNYGLNSKDVESRSAWPSGFIVHEYSEIASNWQSEETVRAYLKRKGIPALCGIDTRALTRHIRSQGAMNALIVSPLPDNKAALDEVIQRAKSSPAFGDRDLVAEVTCKESYDWVEPVDELRATWNQPKAMAKNHPLVVVMDFGVKHNMLRNLAARGIRVKVVPSHTSADVILAMKPAGVLLSNGPGDPAMVGKAPDTVRALLGKVPLYGICMGHQILSLAIGARTYKLKFGHHGANQPVLDIKSGKVIITSQNHGYAVDPGSLPAGARVSQINLNDKSVEGIEIPEKKALSVQYHPEACPGPHDSMGYFDEFIKAMNDA